MIKETGTVLLELCQKPEILQSAGGAGIAACPYTPVCVLAPQWEKVLYAPFYLLLLSCTLVSTHNPVAGGIKGKCWCLSSKSC